MKSYFSGQHMLIQGKAWQIRILLAQWAKEAGKSATVKDFVKHRHFEPSLTTKSVLTRHILG